MSTGPTQPTASPSVLPLGYAAAQRHESRWGKGFLSVCASMLFVGLGHWIAGARRRAIGWFVAYAMILVLILVSLCITRLQPALIFLLPIDLLVFLALYIDAFIVGRRSNRSMLGLPWRRYVSGILLLVLAHFAQRVYLPAFMASFRAHTEAFVTTSRGMSPTLAVGDRFLTTKSFTVNRWDIVAVHPPINPATLFTDRVVGLPGETVELVGGKVNINGVPMNPPGNWGPYQNTIQSSRLGNGCQGNPITLGPDEYFLLGDNSPIALDARYWTAEPRRQPGAIARGDIVAKVTFIYWPPRNWRQFR